LPVGLCARLVIPAILQAGNPDDLDKDWIPGSVRSIRPGNDGIALGSVVADKGAVIPVKTGIQMIFPDPGFPVLSEASGPGMTRGAARMPRNDALVEALS